MLLDIKSHCNTHFIKKFQTTNKNKVKSVKILKMSTFCNGWCSNIALNNIKNKENFTDEET